MLSYPPEVLEAVISSQDLFVWEAPAYPKYERTKTWYLVMSLIAVFLVAYAIWTANFLFAFIVLLSAIVLILAGNKDPERILVQIGDNGVVWHGHFYPFQDIDNFAIIYQPPYSKILYLEPKGIAKTRVRISLEDENPLEIRQHLKQYLPEDLDLRDEHFSDIMARLMRI